MKFVPMAVFGVLICITQNAFGLTGNLVIPDTGSLNVQCTPSGTSCSRCTTYKCDSGYYGTATSASAGCTVCPSNATCAGGNDSTFVCSRGYYKDGDKCTKCPSPGTTGLLGGAEAITECYIMTGYSFSDDSGSVMYTGNCYYQL